MILNLLERLIIWFIPNKDTLSEKEYASQHLLVSVTLITTLFSLLYVGVSHGIGFSYGVTLMWLNFILLWLQLFLLRSTGLFRISANLYLANCTFIAVLGCSFFSGGLASPVMPWFALPPVASVLLLGFSKDSFIWLMVSCSAPICYGLLASNGYTFNAFYHTQFTDLFSIICFIGLICILFLIAFSFNFNRNQAMQQLLENNIALDQAREQAEEAKRMLETLASMDTLTNIANRRTFDLVSEKEWKRCQREDLPISFVMIDVDHFKQYNDNYGHGAGDECLVNIAKVMNRQVNRPCDIVARYGGEEFAAVLSETDREGALEVAKKFHAAIAKLAIPHAHSEVSDVVTISIGVATTSRANILTLAQLSKAADQMLYQAKASGRSTTQAVQF